MDIDNFEVWCEARYGCSSREMCTVPPAALREAYEAGFEKAKLENRKSKTNS